MRTAALICFLVLLSGKVGAQSYGNRAQTISNIFQIPIQTLTAVSNFVQGTRPLGEIIQRRRNPQPLQVEQAQQVRREPSSSPLQSSPVYSLPRSKAAKVAGLYTAADGSGFRI